MNGKLIPVFVLAALMSCSQPPVKEQGPRPVKLAEVTSLNLVEKSFSGVVSPDQFSDLAFKMSGPLISLKVDEGQKGAGAKGPDQASGSHCAGTGTPRICGTPA